MRRRLPRPGLQVHQSEARSAECFRELPRGGVFWRPVRQVPVNTEANSVADLYDKVRDAVRCHFDEGQSPRVIRLHFVREEVITA